MIDQKNKVVGLLKLVQRVVVVAYGRRNVDVRNDPYYIDDVHKVAVPFSFSRRSPQCMNSGTAYILL